MRVILTSSSWIASFPVLPASLARYCASTSDIPMRRSRAAHSAPRSFLPGATDSSTSIEPARTFPHLSWGVRRAPLPGDVIPFLLPSPAYGHPTTSTIVYASALESRPRSSTTPNRHLLEAREPAPVRARVLCAAGLGPAAPRGDARAARRVLRIPMQDRVIAHDHPVPHYAFWCRQRPRSFIVQDQRYAPLKDPCADPCADAGSQRRAGRRAGRQELTPPRTICTAPDLGCDTRRVARASARTSTYGIARRCRGAISGRGRASSSISSWRRGQRGREEGKYAVEAPALLVVSSWCRGWRGKCAGDEGAAMGECSVSGARYTTSGWTYRGCDDVGYGTVRVGRTGDWRKLIMCALGGYGKDRA
ncbi:hypothetical protein B0H13DRAFT_437357 [Mycena leptocephala]|nr:hypothetical protein B0H13DRAFT_437357 [Mycena leptocephala]